jgi:isopentenyl-diphosphate delta-isomerase
MSIEQAASQAEMLDIVDEHGNPTGARHPKSYVHRQGLRHRDVHVWVTDGQNLWQQQRHWDKSIMPGQWDITVGEHVMAGESYLDGAARGVGEELGLWLPQARFIPAGTLAVEMTMQRDSPRPWLHRTVGDNFVVVERDIQVGDLALQESEVIGIRAYPINQLEADLANPETAALHAEQPMELWRLGITAMRTAIAEL